MLPQIEDISHFLPLSVGARISIGTLKLSHEMFPLHDLWILAIPPGLVFKAERVTDGHHHDQLRSRPVNLHIEDSRIANTVNHFRPRITRLVVLLVLAYQFLVIVEVQFEAELSLR